MTIVENQQQQRQAPPDRRTVTSSQDLAREHGNRTDRLANLAEQQHDQLERERETRARYEDGFQSLAWLTGAPWGERHSEIDRGLHDEHGSLVPARIGEWISLILAGRTSLEARKTLAARYGQQAMRDEAARRTVAEAREVSVSLHRLAEQQPQEAPVANGQPALPSATSARATPVPLPQRVPGASRPPTAAETTGEMVAIAEGVVAVGADKALKPSTVQALRDGGFVREQPAGPDYSPSALPQTRTLPTVEEAGSKPSDTATMPVVEEAESKLPFSGAASTAAAKQGRPAAKAAAGKGGDDA